MLAKGSIRLISPAILVGLVILYFNQIIGVVILTFALYLIWFFRDPNREIISDESQIYAAADGKIVYCEHSNEEYKFSIRMSPFNVHINRSPISGTVTEITHQPGYHQSVYFGGDLEKNEKNLIVIENENYICKVLQITGIFARRIECWINQGEKIQQGEKIGIIRFGSQTNVTIILKTTGKAIKQIVSEGDQVRAGISSLALIV